MTGLKNRAVSLLITLTALIAVSAVYSTQVNAETGRTFEVPAKKDEVEEVRFKDAMEARLNRDLQAYLGNNRFIIHVEAELKKTRTVVKQENARNTPAIPPRPVFNSQPIPAVNNNSGFSIHSNNRDQLVEESLPGLPTSDMPIFEDNREEVNALKSRVEQLESERQQILNYAEQLRKDVEQKVEQSKQKTLGYRNSINKLTITLVLDKSLKDEQVEFIRNLITRKARLDELRGDSLAVVRTEFKDIEKNDLVISWWQEHQAWIILASFGLIMLLLLLALYLFNKRLSDNFQANQRSQEKPEKAPIATPSVEASRGNLQEDSAQDRRRQFNEMRQELVTIGLGQPQLFQQRIAEQINNGNSQNVAALYEVMGKSLFRSLCPKLPSQDLEQISDIAERQSLDSEQKMTGLNNLRHELLKAMGGGQRLATALLLF